MHKIFGHKHNAQYTDRPGAYIIPVKNGKVAVAQTPKGYFLLGGGIEENETDLECIQRECMEEIGYSVEIKEPICSAETYLIHPQIGYFHPIQHYYGGTLLHKVQEPKEKDHSLVWIEYETLINKMYVEMQGWAIWEYFKKYYG